MFLLFGLAQLAGCADPHERAAAFQRQGEALLAAGNPRKAQLEFLNATSLDPANAATWYGLARAELDEGRWREAARALRATLEREPAHLGALIELGQLYFLAGDADAVAAHAERVQALAPERMDGAVLRAGALLLQGDAATALATLEPLLPRAPRHRTATLYAARACVALDDAARGIALLERWLAEQPEDVLLRQELVALQEATGDIAGVRATRAELMRRSADERPHRLALARYLLEHDDASGAIAELAALIARHPEDAIARRSYLELVRQQQGAPRALAEVERMSHEWPNDVQLRLELARLHLEQQEFTRAKEILEAIKEEVPADAPAAGTVRARLAAIAARTGDEVGALRELDRILTANPRDREALILRGTLRLNAGQARAAINDLRMAQRADGDDPNLRRLLARAHLANGEAELAIDQWRKAVVMAPEDASLRQELAGLYLEIGNHDGAIDELLAAERLRPDDFDIANALCRAHARAGTWPQALRYAERMQQLAPDRAAGYHQAGMVQLELGKPEQAERNFLAALQRQPDAVQPLTMLVRRYHADGRTAAADQVLRATIARYPDHETAQSLLRELKKNELPPMRIDPRGLNDAGDPCLARGISCADSRSDTSDMAQSRKSNY